MATVRRQLGAFCGKSSIVSVTYNDANMSVSQVSAVIVGGASCLVEIRDTRDWSLIGSQELRAGATAYSVPGGNSLQITPEGDLILSGNRAFCLIGTQG